MCKPNTQPDATASCAGSSGCSGRCLTAKKKTSLMTAEALTAAAQTVKDAKDELAAVNPHVQAAAEQLADAALASVELSKQTQAAGLAKSIPIVVRRMKTPQTEGPIAGEAIAGRMMEICGCHGQYDCDCVSVKNMARAELWYRHNAGVEDPSCLERRASRAARA